MKKKHTDPTSVASAKEAPSATDNGELGSGVSPCESHSYATIPAGCADFLARVGHDLRSPLGVIAEVLPVLEADLEPHLTAEHKLLLKLAERGVRRLRMFVERMRIASDLELSRLELVQTPTDLSAVIQDGVDMILAAEPRRGITVSVEPATAPVVLKIDSQKLTHVIVELVSNAVRHAHKNVRIVIERERGETKIQIEDDGDGISEGHKKVMFERFVERQTRHGLGIGLSLARDLVSAQGGELAFGPSSLPTTRPGSAGAKFVVSFKAI